MEVKSSSAAATGGLRLPAISPQKPLVATTTMATTTTTTAGGDAREDRQVMTVDVPTGDAENAEDGTPTQSGKRSRKKDKKKDELVPHADKPLDFEFWTRCMDIHHNIYYYNTHTGESTWLAPCCICHKHSDKWCQDCGVAYCDKHFAKKHNTDIPESVSVEELGSLKSSRHRWAAKEMPSRKEIQAHDSADVVKCVECSLRRAVKMCLECWDAYCVQCFEIVHHVGALRLHPHGLYDEVSQGWMCVRTGRGDDEDDPNADADSTVAHSTDEPRGRRVTKPDRFYIHGITKETTYEKPVELMNPLERTLLKNWQTHQTAALEHVERISELQFELEKARYERDQLLVEKMQNLSKPKDDDDALRPLDRKGKGGDDPYMAKLMNPTNRKRGEGRSNYIQSLLDAPLPTKTK